jgi:uncharacterized membrane protein
MKTRTFRRLPSGGALLPLVVAYLLLFSLYAWQAWVHRTVTLFSDEIEFSQASRSIAETGHATLRLRPGQDADNVSLFAYLAAPAWWIDDIGTAYLLVKLLGVALMTATIFPAYALARKLVSRPYALFAAIGTTVAPALSYSPFLVDEPLAYLAATLGFLAILQAGITPSARTVGLALAACALCFLVRTQLTVMFVVLGLVLLAHAWRSDRARRWRATWSAGDWVGSATLVVGGAVLLSTVIGHRSVTWYVATGFDKQRMLEYGLGAFGALAIGVGIVPLVATLAALARRTDPLDETMKAFASVTVSALAVFGMYTAVKATYLSRTFAIIVAERNLIYVTPLLFVGMALALERRRYTLLATAAATALAVYLVSTTPLHLDQYPYYEAHGLAIAALANRIPAWPAETIEHVLVVVALASGLALAGLTLTRWRRAIVATGAVLAVFTLAWSLTTEIYAANGERRASDQAYAALPKPADWVDQMTGREGTLFVGQGISDPNAFWQLEFWNPSIRWLWGIDGSTPGGVTPNLLRPDGTLDPSYPGAEYVVASKGLSLAVPEVTTVGDYVVYRLRGQPVRLTQASSGIDGDGWMHDRATYTRYAAEQDPKGFVLVRLSREASCYPQLKPVHVSARVGPVVVSDSDQPVIGKVTATREGELVACKATGLLLPVPDGPWHVEATVSETFVPRELDSNSPDTRALGAKVSFELVPLDSE